MRTGAEYIESLRNRELTVWYRGKKIVDPVDHPVIAPSVRAVAATFDLAHSEPEIGSCWSPLAEQQINRFLHIAQSTEDVVAQNRMQRKLGQMTGTCFQRCVGMDASNALYSVTYDCDQKHKTMYHRRFVEFLVARQKIDEVIGGAMTDPKGDRSKGPADQVDPDLFLRVVDRDATGVYVSGAKMHQTGCLNAHWLLLMPTIRMRPEDSDWAIAGAVKVDAPGITYIYGRQSCDDRAAEENISLDNPRDTGNSCFGGQEAMIVFDRVHIPAAQVFMDGEVEMASPLVNQFTGFHRRSYICKAGVGDVLIGAAAQAAEYHGVEKASHIKDKIIEMNLLNETIAGTALAACYQSKSTPAGSFQPDELLANICKQHVTRFPFEIARLAQDLAGGLMGTLPAADEFEHEEIGPILEKYLQVVPGVAVEDRRRLLRLLENMTLGRNAVGYLTESMHGAGSPQAQRIRIASLSKVDEKKNMARKLAGINSQ
ncbi:MAG: 4-hydroxybutyryl-CoA dehydratase [Zetaproteobacteria bacterium]|nr:4-hydroxybutyryl-CoA dehydratase [Pseudobdellovibrionaceae bacterium]